MSVIAPRPARKPLLAFAAAIGLTAIGTVALQLGGGIETASAAITKDGSRWFDAFGTPGPVPTPTARDAKSDRISAAKGCETQDWPYVGRECLVAANGSDLRIASRTITIGERNEAARTSTLIRMPVAQMALR